MKIMWTYNLCQTIIFFVALGGFIIILLLNLFNCFPFSAQTLSISSQQRLWPLGYIPAIFFRGDCFHALKNRSPRPFHNWKVGHQCCFVVQVGSKTNNLHIRKSHHFPSYILIASRDTSAPDPLLLLCCHRRLYQVLRKHFQNICASKLLKVSNLLQSRWKLKSCRVFIGGGEWCLSVWWIVAEGEGGWVAACRGTDTRQILLQTW